MIDSNLAMIQSQLEASLQSRDDKGRVHDQSILASSILVAALSRKVTNIKLVYVGISRP